MKYNVISILISVVFSNAVLADTIIDCHRPPGGQIRCPDTLAAVCHVRSGAVYGMCLQAPTSYSLSDKREFFSRMASEGQANTLLQSLSDDDIRQAISRGEFKSPVDGSNVRFRLPRKQR